MTDIVERLRKVQGDNADVREAAAEIERLRKTAIETMHEMLRRAQEIERLRANEAAAILAFRETNNMALEEIKRLRAELEQHDRTMNMSD